MGYITLVTGDSGERSEIVVCDPFNEMTIPKPGEVPKPVKKRPELEQVLERAPESKPVPKKNKRYHSFRYITAREIDRGWVRACYKAGWSPDRIAGDLNARVEDVFEVLRGVENDSI